MITLEACRQAARDGARAIQLWSPAAEDLLVGTALQESGLAYTKQLGGGPARGYWQMEPATHDDIWRSYVGYRLNLGVMLERLVPAGANLHDELERNPVYGAAMARLKYHRSPLPLPPPGDISGMAKLWKAVYNTGKGAGSEAEFLANWRRFYPSGDGHAE